MNRLRPAHPADVPALEDLSARSARELSVPYYTAEQTQALLRFVFGVDSQLIEDGTYFVIEGREPHPIACGGWSKRATLSGGDQAKQGPDRLLDPLEEPARVRAFFVDPSRARSGLGRELMAECLKEARPAGFSALELVSTLSGEAFYLASGFTLIERFALDLPGPVRVLV